MKLTLLFFFILAVLFQSGCATRPSGEEQAREEQQNEQTVKKSDAFAKSLPQ